MRTGTTANWTTGTGEIAKLQRTPYFHVDCDFYGSTVTEVDSGSLYHDDFSGTAWPDWLTVGTTGTGVVTRGGGTASFQSAAAASRAYVVTNAVAGSPAPNSGKFVLRTRGQVTGSANVMYLMDVWDSAAAPLPTTTDGQKPRALFSGGSVYAGAIGGLFSGVGATPAIDYIAEGVYDGTNLTYGVYGSNMGTLIRYTAPLAFTDSMWAIVGEARTNAGVGTLTAKYISLTKGTSLSVGNLGSGYVAQVYGSDDTVIGSAQSSAQSGTATVDIASKEYPLYGYFKCFTDTTQGSQLTRYPSTGNGTFWGGGVYKVGTGNPDINDITSDVQSLRYRVEYEDTLTGYVPSGAISGDCDITLKTGSKYSYFNRSAPYYGIARLNRDVKVDTGFDVSGTSQYLSAFTGLTSEFQTSGQERAAQLKCLDRSELLRRKSITWDLMHNVRSDNIVKMVLAECGIPCYPPADFFCKFDNSTASEDGIEPFVTRGTIDYVVGKWGVADSAISYSTAYLILRYLLSGDVFGKGYVSFWMGGSQQDAIIGLKSDENNLIEIEATAIGASPSTVKGYESGVSSTRLSFTGPTSGEWNHICITWDTETNVINGYVNGELADTDMVGTTWPSGEMRQLNISLGPDGGDPGGTVLDHLMIGNAFLSPAIVRELYSAEATDAESIGVGLNVVEWLYAQEKDAWNLIKEICQAEGAKFWFDADGDAHFANRHSLMNDNQISVKTISHDSDVAELNLTEDSSAVINRAVVRSSPLRKQAGTDIFSAQGTIRIPAPKMSGTRVTVPGTKVFYVWWDGPAVEVDTSFSGTYGSGMSKFQAYYQKSVLGSKALYSATGSVSAAGTAYSTGMRIKISSSACKPGGWAAFGVPRVFPAVSWIGQGGTGAAYSTDDPDPYLYIYGKPITPNVYTGTKVAELYVVAEDSDSQSTYGTHSVEIENSFIQDDDYAKDWAKWVVMNNAEPVPRLEDVTIMADPRLEAGDRVTVVDAAGNTGLQDDFWVLGIDNDYGPPWTQNLTLNYASGTTRVSQAPILILDHPTQGQLDLNCPAF